MKFVWWSTKAAHTTATAPFSHPRRWCCFRRLRFHYHYRFGRIMLANMQFIAANNSRFSFHFVWINLFSSLLYTYKMQLTSTFSGKTLIHPQVLWNKIQCTSSSPVVLVSNNWLATICSISLSLSLSVCVYLASLNFTTSSIFSYLTNPFLFFTWCFHLFNSTTIRLLSFHFISFHSCMSVKHKNGNMSVLSYLRLCNFIYIH